MDGTEDRLWLNYLNNVLYLPFWTWWKLQDHLMSMKNITESVVIFHSNNDVFVLFSFTIFSQVLLRGSDPLQTLQARCEQRHSWWYWKTPTGHGSVPFLTFIVFFGAWMQQEDWQEVGSLTTASSSLCWQESHAGQFVPGRQPDRGAKQTRYWYGILPVGPSRELWDR